MKIMAGNWKMNKGGADAFSFAAALTDSVKQSGCKVILCVPFTAINLVSKAVEGSKIAVGAQNISFADSGAYTGEISAAMLLEAGATYAIVGHSERRAMFGETDISVNQRTKKALEKGITPIVCVGETLDQRKGGITENVLTTQLSEGLSGLDSKAVNSLVIAYEPVWAIGTGVTATVEQAGETVAFIRKFILDRFSASPSILYGGSMNGSNCADLLRAGIDGGLIGGASLKQDEFTAMVMTASAL